MKDKKNYYLIKTIIIFVCYVFYANIINRIFSLIGINNSVNSMFTGDLIFFIVMIFIYKDKLKENFANFKNEYSTKNKIVLIIKWILILFGINMLIVLLKKILGLNINNVLDENSMAVLQLFDISFVYSLFKTLIFAPIAEELLFKQSIRDVVKNDIAFVLISSSIYTAMNFMYASTGILFLELIKYFMFSLILSLVYIKNNDNIIIIMFIKFFYNLFPTLLLIATILLGVSI